MNEDSKPTVAVEAQVGTTPLPEKIKKTADVIRQLMDLYGFEFEQARSLVHFEFIDPDLEAFYPFAS